MSFVLQTLTTLPLEPGSQIGLDGDDAGLASK